MVEVLCIRCRSRGRLLEIRFTGFLNQSRTKNPTVLCIRCRSRGRLLEMRFTGLLNQSRSKNPTVLCIRSRRRARLLNMNFQRSLALNPSRLSPKVLSTRCRRQGSLLGMTFERNHQKARAARWVLGSRSLAGLLGIRIYMVEQNPQAL